MSSSTETTIRLARPADAGAIGDIFLSARAEALPHVRPVLSDAETRTYLAGLIDNPRCTLWVAERDAELLGFLALQETWVDHLYVRPAWYRHGIGTMLLDHAKRARPLGLRLFCFQCDSRARAFYAASGLVEVRSSDGSGNPEREPDMEFRWASTACGQNRSSP